MMPSLSRRESSSRDLAAKCVRQRSCFAKFWHCVVAQLQMSFAGAQLASILAKNVRILVEEGFKLHLGSWREVLRLFDWRLFLAFHFLDAEDARPVNPDEFQQSRPNNGGPQVSTTSS